MSTFIHGKDLRVYKNSSGFGNQEIGGSKECDLELTTNLKEVTGAQSANFREFRPDLNGWTITTSGLIAAAGYNFEALCRDWAARTKITILFSVDAGGSGSAIYSGCAYITSVKLGGSYGSIATYAISLQGTGLLNITSTITPPSTSNNVNRIEYSAGGGETTITDSRLIGASAVLSVMRGGFDVGSIIITGTPVGDQKKFTAGTGTVTFATASPLITGEFVVILWK